MFSVTHDIITSEDKLNNDLAKINNWAFQWKMNFNPDPKKQAQEAIFSRNWKKISQAIIFNITQVSQSFSQKRLGIILDEQLIFCEHLKILTSKIRKTIGHLQNLQSLSLRSVSITIYKALVRPNLDCGDTIYDEA